MVTDKSIEKNFRVVVIRLQVSGPNVAMVSKMKCYSAEKKVVQRYI